MFNMTAEWWVDGVNQVVIGNVGGEDGIVTYAADFVGVNVY